METAGDGNINYMVISDEHRKICDSSLAEVVLYYLVNPGICISQMYESLCTMSWKFNG